MNDEYAYLYIQYLILCLIRIAKIIKDQNLFQKEFNHDCTVLLDQNNNVYLKNEFQLIFIFEKSFPLYFIYLLYDNKTFYLNVHQAYIFIDIILRVTFDRSIYSNTYKKIYIS